MIFNQKTGLAETDGRIDFRVPQAIGNGARGDLRHEKERIDAAFGD